MNTWTNIETMKANRLLMCDKDTYPCLKLINNSRELRILFIDSFETDMNLFLINFAEIFLAIEENV